MRSPLIKLSIINLDLKVSDLIDRRSKDWRRNDVRALFYQADADADAILASRPATQRDDYWIWKYNKSGAYSVKSGYWVESNKFEDELKVQESFLPSINEIKEMLWKVHTSSKIEHFSLNAAVAVDDSLQSRGIKTDGFCQVCAHQGESINHILFVCLVARLIWALSGFPMAEGGFSLSSIYCNIFHLLITSKRGQRPSEVTRIFPWIVWFMWKNINSLLFEGLQFGLDKIVDKAKEEAQAWFAAQEVSSIVNPSAVLTSSGLFSHWKKPHQGWIKCNIGAALDKNANVAGAAWVLLDHEDVVSCTIEDPSTMSLLFKGLINVVPLGPLKVWSFTNATL